MIISSFEDFEVNNLVQDPDALESIENLEDTKGKPIRSDEIFIVDFFYSILWICLNCICQGARGAAGDQEGDYEQVQELHQDLHRREGRGRVPGEKW